MILYNQKVSEQDAKLYTETQYKLNNSNNEYDNNMYFMIIEEIKDYYYRKAIANQPKKHNYMNLIEV